MEKGETYAPATKWAQGFDSPGRSWCGGSTTPVSRDMGRWSAAEGTNGCGSGFCAEPARTAVIEDLLYVVYSFFFGSLRAERGYLEWIAENSGEAQGCRACGRV